MCRDRVVVAMSGGVDSSVAAAFLKEKGYDVIGITMKLGDRNNRCCSDQDVQDARSVSRHLGIPHHVVSFRTPFKKQVVDYFVSEYVRGRTPNPCAVCNPTIKFGELLKKALSLNARLLATGHYARVIHDRESGRYALYRGKERGKDQSYFLARLSQESLRHALFPVGNFPKAKIRQLAQRFGLLVSSKTESQEVCFIPDGDVAGFIEHQQGASFPVGSIVDGSGRVMGKHRGVIGYTIGQRKGLGIAAGKPVYVTRIDAGSNTVVVGDWEDLYHKEFIARDPHWISTSGLTEPLRVKTKIRYKHRPAWSDLTPLDSDSVRVRFEKAQRAITPGQLAVFYDGDAVLGSAWIDEVVN